MIFRIWKILPVVALAVAIWSGTAAAATLELSGPAGAALMINNQTKGYFPLSGPLELAPGHYQISATRPGFFPFEKNIFLESDSSWIRVHTNLLPFKKSTAWKSSLLYAGLGQFYMGQKTKGWLFVLAETGGLLTALAGEAQRINYRDDYLIFKDKYDSSINAEEIADYRSKANTAYANMEDMTSLRTTGLLVAGGAILVSILDVLLFFPAVEAGPGSVPLQTGSGDQPFPADLDLLTSFHAGFRVAF